MAVTREQFKQVLLGILNPNATNATESQTLAEKINERIFLVPTASLSAAVATAATNGFAFVMKADRALKIKDVQINPSAAITSDNTNYASFALQKNDAAGGAAVNIAVGNTTNAGGSGTLGGSLAANTSYSLTLTAANATVNANQALLVSIVKGGAGGVAVPAGSVIVIRAEEV